MEKPIIKYSEKLGMWVCKSAKYKEYGDIPIQAYIRWRILRDQHTYARRDIFSKFAY